MLFGCSNKNNIINLRCTFYEFKNSDKEYFEEFQPNDDDLIVITFNKTTKEGTYYTEDEKIVHNFEKTWLDPELITLEKSEINSWYKFYDTYKINRMNGQITLYEHRIYKTGPENTGLVQSWKRGECYLPNEKPLF